MGKDAYWFKHDSTAGRGLKMRKMAHIHGHWGKGIYWDVIEILRDQADYSFDHDDTSLHMLSDIIGCKDVEKFRNWFSDCIKFELFVKNRSKFFSPVLCENMQKWEKQKRNGSQPKSQTEAESKPNGSRIEAKRKPNRSIIEEESIEEEKREDNLASESFEQFWNLYDKKRGRPKCERLWADLSQPERDLAMAYIPAYKLEFEQKYRKDPERFLKYKCWNDQLVNSPIPTVTGSPAPAVNPVNFFNYADYVSACAKKSIDPISEEAYINAGKGIKPVEA